MQLVPAIYSVCMHVCVRVCVLHRLIQAGGRANKLLFLWRHLGCKPVQSNQHATLNLLCGFVVYLTKKQ